MLKRVTRVYTSIKEAVKKVWNFIRTNRVYKNVRLSDTEVDIVYAGVREIAESSRRTRDKRLEV